MNLAIAAIASRGHVQPCIAIGKELQRRGHRVTLVTHEDYCTLARSHGLDFRGVCGNYEEIISSKLGTQLITPTGNPLKTLSNFRRLLEPYAERWCSDFSSALGDAEGVIVESTAMPALVALEARSVPRVIVSAVPSVPTGELGFIGVPGPPIVAEPAEKYLCELVLNQAWSIGRAAQADFLARHNLTPLSRPLWRENLCRGIGHLLLSSEAITPRPGDWPKCAEVTGFCLLDSNSESGPQESLVDFLNAGPAPVYVTFGSNSGMSADHLASIAVQAIRMANCRGVIGLKGVSHLNSGVESDVLFTDEAPYDWLLPRVSAVVHYGGAGTASAVLKAGKPSVVTPFVADQHFWARRLAELGVSPTPIKRDRLSPRLVASSLREVLTESCYTENAKKIGGRIQMDDGVNRTVNRIIHYLSEY